MIKKLLFFFFIFSAFNSSAQQTYDIDWTFGSNSNVVPATAANNADRTIEVGDTVRWTWVASGSHNVVSQPGSQESFSSGAVQGTGTVFSHTFTQVGVNDYVCEPHSGTMFGRITVVSQGTLSTSSESFIANDFTISPNPGRKALNISLSNTSGDFRVEVFNVLGKRIYKGVITGLESSVDVTNWKSGVYLVRVSNDKMTHTKRFIKQ